MKTVYKILFGFLLSLIFSSSNLSQGFDVSWKWNGPNGNRLNDIFVVNSLYSLAVGNCGTVWKTTNGGSSWALLEVPWTDDCLKVWLTDPNTIFIFTKDSADISWKIRRSTDNGLTWTFKTPGSRSENGIAMLTKDYGYTLSGYNIYRTANFFSSTTGYSLGYQFTDINIADSLNIYVSGYYNYLVRSVNGGSTWTTVNCGKSITGLTMIDTTGYAISSTNRKDLYKTTDRGNTFSLVYTFTGYLQKLVFSGRDSGFALVTDGFENNTIYKTTNGGSSWSAIRTDLHLLALHQYQKTYIFAAGAGGRLSSSTNGGASWRNNSKIGYDFNCVSFPTNYTGYVAGDEGAFFKFGSGGDIYSRYTPAGNRDILDMFFLDSLTGFIAGEKGMLKKTTNGGNSFIDYQLSDTSKNITALNFCYYYDSWYGYLMKVFMCNSSGEVFISSDTCQTWTQLTVPNNDFIVDGDGIYFGSNSGKVYKYNISTSALTLSLAGILVDKVLVGFRPSASYLNDNEAYAIDKTGLTVGKEFGYQWLTGEVASSSPTDFVATHDYNYVTGWGGSIKASADLYYLGIKNWEQILTPTHATINSIVSRTSSELWAVGDDGVILKIIKMPSSNFQLAADTSYAVAGDTAVMDINLESLSGGFSSVQFSIYTTSDMTLAGIDTAGTLMGAKKWSCFVNGTTQPARFAAGGANDIISSGTLVRLKFRVNSGVAPKDISTTVSSLIVNNGTHAPVVLRNGVVKVVKYGDVDVNGIVQAYDASLILKYLVNYVTLSGAQKKIGDVSKDGTLSDVDASLIFRYVVGLIDSLPAPGSYLATGSISMNDYNANAGQILSIPVAMNGVTGLMGFEGSITFDPQKLEFIGASATGIASNFAIEHKVVNGRILVAAASQLDAAGSGDGVILQFRVKENAVIGNTKVKIARLRLNENAEQFDVAEASINILTGIKGEGSIPKEYELSQNYPNPFNPETRIIFGIPEVSRVTIQIFNSLGEETATLLNEERPAGYYNLNWDALNFPTGIYIVRMKATSSETGKSFMQIRKMVLVK